MGILLNNRVDRNVATFDMRSPEAIAKMNGTITGSPTFDADGIKLDGSNDYVTYAIPNTLFASDKISFVVEFTPDFAYDEDVQRALFVTSFGDYIMKMPNSNSNSLYVTLGGTFFTITAASYSSYWKQNERNVLVLAGTSNNVKVWLNGHQVYSVTSFAWTNQYPTTLTVGLRGTAYFDGKIHSITVHNDLLTEEDAQALYDNSLFNFQNKADVWLDMAYFDGTDTKDKSGKGNDFEVINADFKNPGFDFDGSNDYLKSIDGTYYDYDEFSIVCGFKPAERAASRTNIFYTSTPFADRVRFYEASGTGLVFEIYGSALTAVSPSDYQDYYKEDGNNVIVLRAKSGDTKVYLNNHLVKTMTGTFTAVSSDNIYIATNSSTTSFYKGIINHFSVYPFLLSPMQVRQITSELLNKYH